MIRFKKQKINKCKSKGCNRKGFRLQKKMLTMKCNCNRKNERTKRFMPHYKELIGFRDKKMQKMKELLKLKRRKSRYMMLMLQNNTE